jgi:tRNA-splicing ligase RtcB
LCQNRDIKLEDRDLAFFTAEQDEFRAYISEMSWAQLFALSNRDEMMLRVMNAFEEVYGRLTGVTGPNVIRCHHNYTVPYVYDGQSVWLSRKGAIDASAGTLGLIPGSMGAASYIVRGKGNAMALNSAPHGAGRLFSRSKAKLQFTMESLEQQMQGIEWRHTNAFLDEHPEAYKPIDVVMHDAEPLVEVVHTLKQMVNVKGD